MAKPPNTALTEAEIETLDAFFAELTGPIRSFEGFDGLICALICAPTKIKHEQYLSEVISANSYQDEKQAALINSMAKRHYEATRQGIDDTVGTDEVYPPALMVDEDDRALGNEWALGFLLGVAMTEADWDDFTKGGELGELMLPMMVLAHEHHPDPEMRPADLSDEARLDLLDMMGDSLVLIYEHFQTRKLQ
jgi:uncharacterized protein